MSTYQKIAADKRRRQIEATRIRAFWAEKGFSVTTWVEYEDGEWRVKSDLVNGAPQGTRWLPLAEGWG